jgi:hypothetical protein
MGQSVFVLLERMRSFALTDVVEPRQRIWLGELREMCVVPDSPWLPFRELITAVKLIVFGTNLAHAKVSCEAI